MPTVLRVVSEHRLTAAVAALSRQPSVADRYERWFGQAFSRWLHETFGAATVVALVFGVTVRCAEKWMAGDAKPRGELVAFALTHPEFGPGAVKALTWKDAA